MLSLIHIFIAQDDVAVLAAHQRNVFLFGPGAGLGHFKLKVDVGDLGPVSYTHLFFIVPL